MRAGVTAANVVEGSDVITIARIAQSYRAAAGENPAVACIARGHHAIEHVDAIHYGIDNVVGCAYPHQIARRGCRKLGRRMAQDALHICLGFSYRQTADSIAVESDVLQPAERFVTQVFVHASLHDAEQRVGIPFMRAPAALRPAQRQAHGFGCRLLIGGKGRALVENHGHVGIQRALYAHGFLRAEKTRIPVDRRAKTDALLADLAHLAQAEHLKTAGIGENRLVPTHEPMQSTVRANDVQAGP